MHIEPSKPVDRILVRFFVFILKCKVKSSTVKRVHLNLKELFYFQIKFTLLHKGAHENVYKPLLGLNNFSVDACSYLGGSTASILLDMFVKDIKRFGNFYHPCPFSVDIQ